MSLKQLFCKHKYHKLGEPFIVFGGRDKYCKILCKKCNKVTIESVFCNKFKQVNFE